MPISSHITFSQAPSTVPPSSTPRSLSGRLCHAFCISASKMETTLWHLAHQPKTPQMVLFQALVHDMVHLLNQLWELTSDYSLVSSGTGHATYPSPCTSVNTIAIYTYCGDMFLKYQVCVPISVCLRRKSLQVIAESPSPSTRTSGSMQGLQ